MNTTMYTDMTENEYQEAVDELKRYVEEHREKEIADETSDCYRETFNLGKNRVIWGQYMREDSAADFSVADVAYCSIYDKELMFFKYNIAPIVTLCYVANYGLSVHRYDQDGLLVLTVDFTPVEVDIICEEVEHRTPDETWARFLENWNQDVIIPIEGTHSFILDSEIKDNIAIINLFIHGENEDANPFTNEELKTIVLNYFDDPLDECFLSLAILNKMNVCFRFCSNISDDWREEIMITPDEYSKFWS